MNRRIGCLLAATALLAGCGVADTPPPSEAVPELTSTLAAVDRALAAHRYPSARRHLAELVDTTEAARRDGTLQDAQADRVLAAAARLLAKLPARRIRPAQAGSTTSSPSPGADSDHVEDEDAKKLEEQRKKLEEERKKLEEEHKKDDGDGD